jgi:hypothetical protein
MPLNPGQVNSRTLPSGRPYGESPSDGSTSRAFAHAAPDRHATITAAQLAYTPAAAIATIGTLALILCTG